MQENLQKDKVLAQTTNQMERATENLERRKAEFDQTHEQLERDKAILIEKCEQTRDQLSEIQDESMQHKLESGREIALLNQ